MKILFESLQPLHINHMGHFILDAHHEEKILKIPKIFRHYPRTYELYIAFWTLGLSRYYRRKIMEWWAPQKNQKVLDFGCGTGANFKILQKGLQGTGQVVGLDINLSFLRFAQSRIKRRQYNNFSLLYDNILDLPNEPYFNIIYVLLVITSLKERETFYDKFKNLLAPGGKVYVADYQHSSRPWLGLVNAIQKRTSEFWGNDLEADIEQELKKHFHKVTKHEFLFGLLYMIEVSEPIFKREFG